MARLGWAMLFVLAFGPGLRAVDPPDPLSQARLLYNLGQFDAAIAAAESARLTPDLADRANLIAARAYLERYRVASAIEDLTMARDRLRRLDPQRFDPRERDEFIVGLGEALYFDQSYGAAAEVFESVLDNGATLAPEARERVLDWWANAVDRDAWLGIEEARHAAYERIRTRMRDEGIKRPGSSAAAYWLAAAARAHGDFQTAWDAAQAGWVRASFAADRGVALRADLDRLMLVAILPEQARATSQSGEALRLEWEKFKERWSN